MQTDGYNKGFYNAYQQASDNVSQIGQIIMLYDGAINFIKQAKEAIIEKNYERRYNLINKAIAIITGLNSCLNFTDETNETAKALDDFYSMIDMRLLYVQCDDSLESCDKIIEDLRVMRNSWVDVEKQTLEASSKKGQYPDQEECNVYSKDTYETSGYDDSQVNTNILQKSDDVSAQPPQTELHITA